MSKARVLMSSALAATLTLSAAAAAPGQTIIGSPHNHEVQRRSSTGVYNVGQAQPATGFRVGYQSGFQPTLATPGGIEPLYFFQLPALPAGQEVGLATFTISEIRASSGVTPTFNVDVYAAGYETGDPFGGEVPPYGSGGIASTVNAPKYFYTGPDQVGAIGAGGLPITKVAEDMFTATEFEIANSAAGNAVKTTDPLPGSDLANYIQAIYDDPANQAGGGYLVLRLTPDALTDTSLGTMRYQFPYAPDTDPGEGTGPTYDPANYGVVTPPQINLVFQPVPEPGTAGLLLFGAAGLLARRRSR